jgi:hypothetical protein
MRYDPIARRHYGDEAIRRDVELLRGQLERAAGPEARRALREAIRERERRLDAAPAGVPAEGEKR